MKILKIFFLFLSFNLISLGSNYTNLNYTNLKDQVCGRYSLFPEQCINYLYFPIWNASFCFEKSQIANVCSLFFNCQCCAELCY